MPADNETSSSTLADLISVELSSQDSVQVVERSEIDRVLKEQDMNATGLTDVKSRIALGKLLKADGFLFLEKSAKDDRVSARLVETVQGFQVGYVFYPTEKTSAEELAKSISADTLKLIPKLSLDPSKRKLVSIIRIGNATLSSDYNWIEDEFPAALSAMLSVHPETIVLERRQLGRLFDEAKLTEAGQTDFAGGAYLLDGEVSITKNVPLEEGDTPLTFTVRIRNSNLRELARAEANGSINSLDELFARTASLTQERIAGLGKQDTTSTETESKILHNMARKYNLLWAAEGAHALSPTNAEVSIGLVNRLVRQGSDMDIYANREKAYASGAESISEATQMCIAAGTNLVDVLDETQLNQLLCFLNRWPTWLDSNTREILRSTRQHLLPGMERLITRCPWMRRQFMEELPGLFDSYLDYMIYTTERTQSLQRDTSLSDVDRLNQICAFAYWSLWPPPVRLSIRSNLSPEPAAFSLFRLMRSTDSPSKRDALANETIEQLTSVLGNPKLLREVIRNTFFVRGDSFREIFQQLSETATASNNVNGLLYSALENMMAETRTIDGFLDLHPEVFLERVPCQQRLALIDIALTQSSNKTARLPAKSLAYVHSMLGQIRENCLSTEPSTDTADASFPRTLYSSHTHPWTMRVRELYASDANLTKRQTSLICPQRLLIDSGILWVGIGGEPIARYGPDADLHTAGLLGIDIRTGETAYLCTGTVKGKPGAAFPRKKRCDGAAYCDSLTAMVMWQNALAFAQKGVGILIFPIDKRIFNNSLSATTVIPICTGSIPIKPLFLTGVGESLFVSDDSTLLEWSETENKVRLLLNASSGLHPNSTFDKWSITAIEQSDAPAILTVHTMGFAKTGHLSYKGVGNQILEFNATTREWSLPTNEPPTETTSAQKWNCSGADSKRALPDNLAIDYDILPYEDGLIAIVGYGTDWKIQFFPGTNTPANVFAWAEAASAVSGNSKPSPLHEAVFKSDSASLAGAIAQSTNMNQLDNKGWTALLHAVSSNNIECTRLLLEAGANANTAPTNNLTPLHVAAANGNAGIVNLLIEHGANLNVCRKDEDQWSPLSAAVAGGHLGVVKLLLDNGANIEQQDKNGMTPILESAHRPHPEILKMLIQRGADAKAIAPYRDPMPLLYHAIQGGYLENVKLVVEHGVDLDECAGWNLTPLMLAARDSSPEVVQYLIDIGQNPKEREATEYGKTPLFMAAEGNKCENIRLLIDAGADVMLVREFKNGRRDTVLDYARQPEARAVLLYEMGKRLHAADKR